MSHRFDAFISYSHSADGRLAPRLESGLKRFAKPWYKLRELSVFRDGSNLNLSPHLWESIRAALDDSAYLICLASPAAAASPWVGREVQHWIGQGRLDRLVLVLTEGELAWDEAAGDFDWARTTCLPRALSGAYRGEPFFLDMRWARDDGADLSLKDRRFAADVALLSATLHGRSVEDMVGEELAQHVRTTRWRNGAIAALSLLLLAAVGAAWEAWRQQREADAQRRLAEEQRGIAEQKRTEADEQRGIAEKRRAEADEQRGVAEQKRIEADEQRASAEQRRVEAETQRRLAEQRRREAQSRAVNVRAEAALAAGGPGLQRALLLAIESLAGTWTAEAHALLLAQTDRLLPPPLAVATDQHGPILGLAHLPAQGLLASQGVDRLLLRSAQDLKPVRDLGPLRAPAALRRLVASPDGHWLLAGCAEHIACLWNTADWQVAWAPETAGALIAAAFSPDGRRLAYALAAPAQVFLVETDRWEVQAPLRIEEGNSEPIQGLAFLGDGDTLLVRTRSGLELHDVRAQVKRQSIELPGQALAHAAPTGAVLADGATGQLRSLRLTRDAAGVPRLGEPGEPVGSRLNSRAQLTLSGDARVAVALTQDRMVQLLGVEPGSPARHVDVDGGSAIAVLGADRLAVGSQDGRVELLDMKAGSVSRIQAGAPPTRLALSHDGRFLATTDTDGTLRVHATPGGRLLAGPSAALPGAVPRFSADGRWLLLAGNDRLVVLSTADWSPRWQLGGPEGIEAAWLTPDGRWVLVRRAEQVQAFALSDGRPAPPVAIGGYLAELRLAPDGVRAAALSPAEMPRGVGLRQPTLRWVWQIAQGQRLGWRSYEREDLQAVKGVTWGRRADDATGEWTRSDGGGDRALVESARSWPLVPSLLQPPAAPALPWLAEKDASGQALHQHALKRAERAHGPTPTSPAWSADGRWLATAGQDGAVWLWSLDPAGLSAQACGRLRRNLAADDWRAAFGDEPYRPTCANLPAGR